MKKAFAAFLILSMLLTAVAVAEAADVTGTWYLVEMREGEQSINPADFGMSITMQLNEDGTAILDSSIETEPQNGTWSMDGETIVVVDGDGQPMNFVQQDGQLVADEDGHGMIFGRADIGTVAKLMGHASVQMVCKHYQRVAAQQKRQSVAGCLLCMVVIVGGGPGRLRTYDNPVMSRGLYQLSYGSTSDYDASFMRAWQALFAGLRGGSVDGLEIVPRVVAGGACRGGFRPFVDVAAVLAAPDAGLGRGEHGSGFDGGGEGEETLFMVFFGHGDGAHDGGDLVVGCEAPLNAHGL